MFNHIESDTLNDADICNMDDDELFTLLDSINYDEEIQYIEQYENFDTQSQAITIINNSDRQLGNVINECQKLFCNHCNSGDHIIADAAGGIMVCHGCGSVLNTIFDSTIEQKTYVEDSKGTLERCSGITSAFLPQTSLATTISGGSSRLKKMQQWSVMPYKEKSLYNVLKLIQAVCRSNGILKCIEDDAKILYKNISETKHEVGKNKGKVIIIRGLNRKSLIAACVFYACKRKGKSRGPKEVATYFNIEYKDLTKGCKIFKKTMKMKYMPYDSQIVKPEHFISDYCKMLNLNKNVLDQSLLISLNSQKLNVAAMHTPISIAIGAILVAMTNNKIPINKNHVAKKFKVSAVTVSKAQKQMSEYGMLLSNSDLVDKITKISAEEKKKISIPFKLQLMHDKVMNKQKPVTLEYLNQDNNLDDYINSVLTESKRMVDKTTEDYLNLFKKNEN
jgi:transcription initiation factor TFIIIB Brf1 subunit/transcription initiation factor TFIIB